MKAFLSKLQLTKVSGRILSIYGDNAKEIAEALKYKQDMVKGLYFADMISAKQMSDFYAELNILWAKRLAEKNISSSEGLEAVTNA